MTRLDESPAGERFGGRGAVAGPVVHAGAPGFGGHCFWAEMHLVDLGAVRLTWVRHASFEARHARRRVRRPGPGLYQLSLPLAESPEPWRQARGAGLAPTDLVLYDTSLPFDAWMVADDPARTRNGCPGEPADGLILQFPQEILPLAATEVARLPAVRLPGQDGVGALLSGILHQLIKQRDPLSSAEAVQVSMVVLDLVAALLSQRLAAGGPGSWTPPGRS